MVRKTIESAKFRGVYLRLAASGLTSPQDKGGGTVNAQLGAGPWEIFHITTNPDGSTTIGSEAFPNTYVRLDGAQVKPSSGDGGVVNAQYGAGPWEKFHLLLQEDGTVAFASISFPGVFLRLDGTKVTHHTDNGGGTVNGQSFIGPYEKFILADVH